MKYHYGDKGLAIGVYPTVSIKQARAAAENARQVLAEGQDPNFLKKVGEVCRQAGIG